MDVSPREEFTGEPHELNTMVYVPSQYRQQVFAVLQCQTAHEGDALRAMPSVGRFTQGAHGIRASCSLG